MVSETRKNVECRARRLLDQPLRVIYHPSFDDRRMRKAIQSKMPDLESFNEKREETCRLRAEKADDIPPEFRPLYEEPIMTREQECHLFRQMNFLKYNAQKLLNGLNPKRCGLRKVKLIEDYLAAAAKLKQQIANSNLRLATQLLRRPIGFYRRHSLVHDLLSDAYLTITRAVDYFDFSLGNKFSTYATWIIFKNFGKDLQNKTKYAEQFVTTDDSSFDDLPDTSTEQCELKEFHHEAVEHLLTLLDSEDCKGDTARQKTILREFFGLRSGNHRTLQSISKDMGCSKERVRQLRDNGLNNIRRKAMEQGITLEN